MQNTINVFKANKILEVITNRDIFIRIYIICSILWFFPALGIFINPISKLCLIWGIFLIVYDAFHKRFFLQTSYWYCIVAMMAMYCITILINIQSNFYMGIKHLAYTAIALMIIFSQNGHRGNADIKNKIKFVNSSLIIIIFGASVISLLMYCLHLEIRFEQNGVIFRQGFLENRLFGVYGSPNIGALFSIISIALTCINSYIKNGSLVKWRKAYIVNGIVQFLYFSLTLSNGGFLTAIVFSTLLVCVYAFMQLRKKKNIFQAILFSTIFAVVIAICLNFAMLGIRKGMSLVPSTIEYVKNQICNDDSEEEEVKIVFDRIESGDDVSNGRTTIWSAGLKIWMQAPLFGVADIRVDEENPQSFAYSLDALNDAEMERITAIDGNLHNSYIQILINSGIVGALCFLVFIILVVKKYIQYLFLENTESGSYKIIGMLFCMLGAIGADGMVENYLLFNRQDPRGMIFWFYLGCGLILIRNAVSGSRFKDYVCRKENVKFLFVCDTPFQLFNVINFVENNRMRSNGKSDLVIVHQFRNSDEFAKKIKEKNLFSNVYDVVPVEERRGVKSKIRTLTRVFFPKRAIREFLATKNSKISCLHRRYFLSFQTPVTISFQLANPYADIFLMEDGLGSYVGNIEEDYTSSLYKIVNKYFLEDRLSLNAVALYLNYPKLCHSLIKTEIRKLNNPKENRKCIEALTEIFGYSFDKHSSEKKYLYLTQPLSETPGYITNGEEKIFQVLADVLDIDDVEIRVHPRQKQCINNGWMISDSSQMWELECIYRINNNQVLISAYSTTLFMPKILNDSEPILIFIYKLLFSNVFTEIWLEKERFIKDFASEYENSNRVFIPETIEEFRGILESLI